MTEPTILTIDGVDSDDFSGGGNAEVIIRHIKRPGIPARRDVFLEVPLRPSSYLFTDQPSDDELVVSLTIVADALETRRSTTRALARWAIGDVTRRWSRLVFSDESDRVWYGRIRGPLDFDELMVRANVELVWRVQPYAFAAEPFTAAVVADEVVLPADEAPAPPIIEVTATPGDPVVISCNGLELGFLMSASGTVTVDSVVGIILDGTNTDTAADGVVSATPAPVDATGSFPLFNTGANALTITGGTFGDIIYLPRYY